MMYLPQHSWTCLANGLKQASPSPSGCPSSEYNKQNPTEFVKITQSRRPFQCILKGLVAFSMCWSTAHHVSVVGKKHLLWMRNIPDWPPLVHATSNLVAHAKATQCYQGKLLLSLLLQHAAKIAGLGWFGSFPYQKQTNKHGERRAKKEGRHEIASIFNIISWNQQLEGPLPS